MGFFGSIKKALGIGGSAGQALDALDKHPETAILSALVPAAGAVNALFPGMGVHQPGLGIVNSLRHPLGRGNEALRPVRLPAGYGPSRMLRPAAVAAGLGTTLQGIQPFTVAGYYLLAGSSNVTKNVNIVDMFAASVTPSFANDDTFPWPFQSYSMRWSIVSEPQAAGKEDVSWQETLHTVFSVATEIARVNLQALGLRSSVIGVTTTGAAAHQLDEQVPSAWPVFYEKNGTYQMALRSDTAITGTNAGLAVSYALDGWVINDTSVADMDANETVGAVEALLRSHTNLQDEATVKATARALAEMDSYSAANMAAGRMPLGL